MCLGSLHDLGGMRWILNDIKFVAANGSAAAV